LSRPIVGDVVGFVLRWPGQQHGALWITGDTVLYGGVREVADRAKVGTVFLHLGGVRFPISGPVRYTMTARQGFQLMDSIRPQTIMPVHYEGWSHFQEGRAGIERSLAQAPESVRTSVRWLPIGVPTAITV
jgi:L-ascorbate metabolism protein UlaG (beta-lactamase superfamily)